MSTIYTNAYIGYIGGSGSPSPVSLPDRSFARSNTRTKTENMNTHDPSPLSMPPHGPRRDTPPPRRGSPVLTHPATVPPQMPLRRVVSQSETISAPGQCRTLRRGLEAVYGPYSTSAPLCTTQHDTARQEHERGWRLNEPSRPCRQGHEGCDLNSVNEIEITPREAVFDGEGNRLLPVTGRGEGVRPRTPARGGRAPRLFRRKSTLWSCQRTLLRPCRAPTAGPPFYRYV